ncbi:MAG: phosphatidylinositol mannoside acyltransferase [Propionibacteriales bacterium]|nr:phosphatidylinositol mannoside acyltransferase [Propionibacteriales bacterium]
MTFTDRLTRQLLILGRRVGPHVGIGTQRALVRIGTELAARANGRHLRTFSDNLAVVTGRPTDEALIRRGVASYLRNWLEVMAMPGWSSEQIVSRVRVMGEDQLRAAVATRGAVVALPHSGNWDLAGAWACSTGLPVTSVAEQLVAAEYADFLAFRRALGMEIHGHREPGLVRTLVDAVRRGRVVCLMADRDLTGGAGVPATFAGQPVTAPGGPAMVARLSGAALFPGVCHYTGRPGTGGMVITLGEEVAHQPGPDGVARMTQQVLDHFTTRIARHPEDWHMMQPFFARPVSGPHREVPGGSGR